MKARSSFDGGGGHHPVMQRLILEERNPRVLRIAIIKE